MNNAFVLISMINIKKIHRTILGLIISAIVILANIFCAYLPVAAATPTTTTINSGSSTFTIPNGVFSMYVELWGAGGGGGGGLGGPSGNGEGGGTGGGGGEYVKILISNLTPGQTIS